jgi:hypothetical protein
VLLRGSARTDTDECLRSAGLETREIERLRAEGVVE